MIAGAKVRLFLEPCKFFIIFFVFILSSMDISHTDGDGGYIMCVTGMTGNDAYDSGTKHSAREDWTFRDMGHNSQQQMNKRSEMEEQTLRVWDKNSRRGGQGVQRYGTDSQQ